MSGGGLCPVTINVCSANFVSKLLYCTLEDSDFDKIALSAN